jgi:hypothetical protein
LDTFSLAIVFVVSIEITLNARDYAKLNKTADPNYLGSGLKLLCWSSSAAAAAFHFTIPPHCKLHFDFG